MDTPPTSSPSRLTLDRLAEIEILSGAHKKRSDGLCAMEAVAWLAGEPHSDAPDCACPVVSALVRRLNDGIRETARRTELMRPLIARLVGSKSTPEVQGARGYLAADWVIRVATPMLLELTPELVTHAEALRSLAPVVDVATAKAARLRAGEAREAARAARDKRYTATTADAAYAAADAYAADAAYAAADAYAADADAADADADAAAADAAAAAAAYAADAAALRLVASKLQEECALLAGRMLDITEVQ